MKILKDDLSSALEELEEGDEEEAHEIVENHLNKALRLRAALESFLESLDEHVEHLNEISNRTSDWDISSVRETVNELRASIDEEDAVSDAMDRLEQVFSE